MALKPLTQLQSERAAAADTLRAAYLDLAAYDNAVASGLLYSSGTGQPLRTFGAQLALPEHPDYSPAPWPNQSDRVRARVPVVMNT
ncbi:MULTISPECIES: hypothetical protein [Pseudomonas]|uniref:Outer membrane efflux protein n=1 Tax=Pseudomonas quercus TaxID=2722792 RepID=A0ABX0YL68_9PSED|nr:MULTISPECIES: hypothetical protein [Pseudomonas]MBF7144135.1 hypothetical protein [Pseudomonas sp. LY10J]NJP02733.1 hypothetical protein [Pseudomonas quercus]